MCVCVYTCLPVYIDKPTHTDIYTYIYIILGIYVLTHSNRTHDSGAGSPLANGGREAPTSQNPSVDKTYEWIGTCMYIRLNTKSTHAHTQRELIRECGGLARAALRVACFPAISRICDRAQVPSHIMCTVHL